MGDGEMDGLIVHTDAATYVVHAACLTAFGDLLERLRHQRDVEAAPAADGL